MYFYPHARVQDYFSPDEITNSQVKLLKQNDISLNKLICQAGALITDYSSLFFDFAYLKKPVVYFHFDEEEFYKGQVYEKGYFDYERDGFGPVCETIEATVDELIRLIENNCVADEKYIKRAEAFFKYRDKNNCARIAEAIFKKD